DTVRAPFVRRDGPMRVGIIEAHNGNSIARLDQGQQLPPARLLVGRRGGYKREGEACVKVFRAQPLHSPVEELGDQGQFIAIKVERLELLGAEAVLDKVLRKSGELLA